MRYTQQRFGNTSVDGSNSTFEILLNFGTKAELLYFKYRHIAQL